MKSNTDKISESKGVLLVPVEVIPVNMNIEQFIDGWKKQEPLVMEIINTKCSYINP